MEQQEIVMKTKISSHNSKLNWSIENVTKLSKLLWGEKFSLLPKCKTKLRCAVKVTKHYMNSFKICIGLQRTDRCKDNITVITSLNLCDSLGKIHFRRCSKFKMSSKDGKIHWCISGLFSNFKKAHKKSAKGKYQESDSKNSDESDFETEDLVSSASEDEVVSFITKDILVVKGSIKIYGCCIVSDSKTMVNESELKETQMAEQSVHETIDDLRLAYESNFFTDIVLKVDCFEIRAHKFVLCARCPYFNRLLYDRTNIDFINIDDMDKRVLEAFLRFLYTGTVGVVQWEIIRKLYAISDKYEVGSLKKNCSLVIKSRVNNLNACDVLILAHEYKDAVLKRFAVNFVIDNFSDAEISHHFSSIVQNHSELAAEVMQFKSLKRT